MEIGYRVDLRQAAIAGQKILTTYGPLITDPFVTVYMFGTG